MSERQILESLVGVLEERFPEAEVFRPRYVDLNQFMYINDEDIDKAGELEDEASISLKDELVEKSEAEDIAYEAVSDTSIIAVDSSSVKLGDTNRGIIAAFRIAVVLQRGGEISIEKFGPYMAHFTESTREIYNYFREGVFKLDRVSPPPVRKMPDRTRNFLERLAQRYANNLIKDGLVLWDGSLTQTIDTPMGLLRDSVRQAHDNGNTIIAISKQSWLKMETGERLVGLLEKETRPCYIYIHDKISEKIRHYIFGRVFVVKFTPDGFSFRVDIAQDSKEECVKAIQLLKNNSTFYSGYPETLRQAHIHAYFTPNEVLALQNMAIDKYDLEVIRSFDVRRHLLAPFG